MRDIDFREVLNELSTDLFLVEYDNGDLSDIGNEVGYILGNILTDMTEDEIKTFIMGFKHGVSLTMENIFKDIQNEIEVFF